MILYSPPASDMTETERAQYEQGAEACRNYSQLTSRARTFAQLIAAAAVTVPFATGLAPDQRHLVFQLGGAILCTVAVGLCLIDWHYQSAFTAIRNRLANMEAYHGCVGPWRAHLSVRTGVADHIASYIPFYLLALLGVAGIILGTDEPAKLWVGITVGLVYVGCLFVFVYRCGKRSSEHKTFELKLNEISTQARGEQQPPTTPQGGPNP